MTQPIYAIGDVHGRSDLLGAIVHFIETDASRRGRAPRVIFLGDIVDRGFDSKGCLDIVVRVLAAHSGSVLLRGNHEQWFLDFIEAQGANFRDWLFHGGEETLMSYGCDGDAAETRAHLRKEHPDHLAIIRDSSLLVEDGPFAFVHAGIDTSVPLAVQTARDCMWIRRPFLDHVGALPRPIVHGHVKQGERPAVTENRISMDTGSHETGRLSVLEHVR